MKFVTNSISTKTKVTTLSEMFKAAQTQAALSKTASASTTVKTAGEPFGGKKAPPFGKGGKPVKKEEKELEKEECTEMASSVKPVKKAEKEEAESSGQLEAKKNPQNDPKVEDKGGKGGGSSKAGKGEGKSGEAESSGQLDVEPLHQEGESTQQKPGDLDTMKEKGEKVEAKVQQGVKVANFKRVSELTPKEKDFLRGVWSIYWPKKFIDSIFAAQ